MTPSYRRIADDMTEIAIKTEHITKIYNLYNKQSDRVKETFHPWRKIYHDPFKAIDNLSFQVKKGESVGIIGRNGSGKSTLLQIVCGILTPTSGSIEVNGRVSALLELGAGFNPEFTGVENIYLNASILGFSKGETDRKFDEILAFADIGNFIHQPVKTYSSGMYVRLAFSIAVHVSPEILIIDEALAVGDIFFRQKCLQHMQNYMHGCTKIIVTHDMQSVANMCERVIVLDEGSKIFEGTPLKGIEYYTKIMHNELFEPAEKAFPEPVASRYVGETDRVDWVEVPEDSRGGAREVIIEKVKITNGEDASAIVVKTGDALVLHFLVRATSSKKNIIFGYTVKDRVNNAIFGENTCASPTGPVELGKGYHHVQLGIKWPEVYPDEYTFTFGIGEGTHPMNHTIQCWAHNMISISSINPDRSVHGLFNNPVTHVDIASVD